MLSLPPLGELLNICATAYMAIEEAVGARVEVEAHEDPAAEGQHHHEGHQRATGSTDRCMTEVRPVDLGLFAHERAKPQVSLGLAPRTKLSDPRPEVALASLIAAGNDHAVQARGGEPRVLLERLQHERDPRVDLGGSLGSLDLRQTRLAEHPVHRRVVHAQLGCNRVDPPPVDEVAPQDLALQIPDDGHRCPLCTKRSARTPRRPRSGGRRKPGRRNGKHSRRQR